VEQFRHLGTNSTHEVVETEVRECLPSFCAESFVFKFAIQKHNDLRYSELQFCLFCTGVRLGLSH